jgi:NAD(P)-dependent dehydrogenase (short-subunit alcohol dehydrogenase family)
MADIFRDRLLQDKVAFITGGGSGINLRIAERFAAQGAKVGLMGRKQEKLDRAAEGIRAAGGEAVGIAGDVRYYEECANALRKTREAFGAIDILVCGAAGNFPATVLGMSANGFKAVIDIDLLGTFNTCRAAYEHLRKPGASVIAFRPRTRSCRLRIRRTCARPRRASTFSARRWRSNGRRRACA